MARAVIKNIGENSNKAKRLPQISNKRLMDNETPMMILQRSRFIRDLCLQRSMLPSAIASLQKVLFSSVNVLALLSIICARLFNGASFCFLLAMQGLGLVNLS
jgi:hypothetical protein